MKKFTLLLALVAGFTVLSPTASEARDHHHGGHHESSRRVAYHCRHCGDAVYQERVFVGYSRRYHHPIFSWRTVSHHCRYSSGHHGHSHHGSFR